MTSIQMGSQCTRYTAATVMSQWSPLSLLATRRAVTVAPDATLSGALDAMQEAGVTALLVDGAGGLITERDIVRALGRGVALGDLVAAAATPHPLVVPSTMTVVEACAVMLNEHVGHLVVDLGANVLGIVSLRDVAAVLLQAADPHLWLASLRTDICPATEIWIG